MIAPTGDPGGGELDSFDWMSEETGVDQLLRRIARFTATAAQSSTGFAWLLENGPHCIGWGGHPPESDPPPPIAFIGRELIPTELTLDSGARVMAISSPIGAGLTLVLAVIPAPDCRSAGEVVSRVAAALRWPFRARFAELGTNRLWRLHRLIGRSALPTLDLSEVAAELAEIFAVDTVSIFLKEGDSFRLGASTSDDSSPASESPWAADICRRTLELSSGGEGRALRLADTRLLAAPLLRDRSAVGVALLSRRPGRPMFSSDDERLLTSFGESLGALLADHFHRMVADSIWQATSESIIVSRIDLDGRGRRRNIIVEANPGAETLMGYTVDQFRRQDPRNLYSPEDHPALRRWLREGAPRTIEVNLTDKDGGAWPVSMSVRSFENRLFRPPVSYSVGVARDVSEHRRPLELLEELGMIYFKSDESGRRIYSSPGESDLTGYTGEELETLPRGALFVEPTLAQLIEKARSSGGRLAEQIVRIRHKESGSFPVQMSVRLVPGESEGKSGLEGFYRDVSERLKLQQFMDRSPDRVMSDAELAQAFAKHEQLHLDYMSSLGHQLLTPLTSLSQHALSLQRDIPRGRVSTRSFEYVVGQARCCIDLVRGWGYLDRILQREKFDTETSIVSLARISIHVKIDMKHLLPPKELDIRIDGESLDRHCQIPCHPGLIRQVIVNLFDNAIKYSYPGTVIEVRGDQNGECPVYEISNEGLEIPEDIRERIFDRGFRSSKAKKLIPHGTGLGLWLDTKILQCHGATISCSVRPDGARLRNVFRIEFPSPRRKREV